MKRKRGFTLLEVMVAAGILVIVISGLLFTLVNCLLLNESNNNMVIAANDAQYVLEQIKGLAYNNIANFIATYNPSTFINLQSETVSFPSYSIGATIAEVTVNVAWTERNRNRNFQLSTAIAK